MDDEFGRSVAVSGHTVVVGAHLEDSNATGVNGNQADNSAGNSGAAYIFVRSGTSWSQQAYVKASNTGTDDLFGWPVVVSGDTVVVGARYEDSSATGVNGLDADNSARDSGAAYVFVRSGTHWGQEAYLKASNAEAGDVFGQSVAVSGSMAVVGARLENSSATGVNGNQADSGTPSSGAAYVFVREGTNWTQQTYLKATNTGVGDEFGWAVAASGGTVVVGAIHERSSATGVNGNQADNSASESGAAYVFSMGTDGDECPDDPNKTSPGACGCGMADVDSDGDGTPDCADACPENPNRIEPRGCGGCGGVCGMGMAVSGPATLLVLGWKRRLVRRSSIANAMRRR